MKRAILAIVGLLLATSAHSDGIRNPISGNFVGIEGPLNAKVGGGGGASCSQTGLIFTNQCNAVLYVVLF